jgi:hypothetical protein
MNLGIRGFRNLGIIKKQLSVSIIPQFLNSLIRNSFPMLYASFYMSARAAALAT